MEILAGRLDTVHLRHPDIQDGNVRLFPLRYVDRCDPVGGLGHHLKTRLMAQQRAEATTDQCVIVGNDDANSGHDLRI